MTIGEKIFHKVFPKIVVHAPAEMLTCKRCGAQYFSRGKNDPGICRNCESDFSQFVGGPLDDDAR